MSNVVAFPMEHVPVVPTFEEIREDLKRRTSLDSIPAELRELPFWAPYELSPRKGKPGKTDKRPKQVNLPKYDGKTSDPAHWGEFDKAVEACKSREYDGVGFNPYFARQAGHNFVIYDVDGCLDEWGCPTDQAQHFIDALDSYTEVSPSGRGIRIVTRGVEMSEWTNHDKGVECYPGDKARFLTITGDKWPGTGGISTPGEGVHQGLKAKYSKEVVRATTPLSGPVPDIIPGVKVPRIPLKAEEFMATGDYAGGDRSLGVQYVARCLADAGLNKAEILSVLAENEQMMAVALDHRCNDHDRAIEYLWKHHVLQIQADTLNDDVQSLLDPEARRAAQLAENERIGQGDEVAPVADRISVPEAVERFVYVADGDGVLDLHCPAHYLPLKGFKQVYSASQAMVGKTPTGIATLWAKDPRRKSVFTRTFKAGAGTYIDDPEGRSAVNMWRPFNREGWEMDHDHAAAFCRHVEFVFGDRAEDFLNWLAHIEQKPGELPHTAWIHVATSTGVGRNWISSVLARVWAGRVASNFDLLKMLDRKFNGRLAGKILASVDEIKEGGTNTWAHSEKMKSLVTEDTREINPKFGREYVEYNACRWLIFSNHITAIPLEGSDRRWEVVVNDTAPKDAQYYTYLYGLLQSKEFIQSIAVFLGQRDISGFSAGAHAKITLSKQLLLESSKSDTDLACEAAVEDWPSDVIFSNDLAAEVGFGVSLPAIRYSMQRVNAKTYHKKIKVGNATVRAWMLRNHELWSTRGVAAIKGEGLRGRELRAAQRGYVSEESEEWNPKGCREFP